MDANIKNILQCPLTLSVPHFSDCGKMSLPKHSAPLV